MKKFSAMLLALAMVFTLFACDKKDDGDKKENSKNTEEIIKETTQETTFIDEAKGLISEKKYEEAYAILYENKTDKEAKELLQDFFWVYEKKIENNDLRGSSYIDEYTYSADGYLLKEAGTQWEGAYSKEYSYDTNGNRIAAVCTDVGGVTVFEYTYNAMGNVTKEVSTDSEGKVETCMYIYDAMDNLTKEVKTSASGVITTYENTYDASGNIITRMYDDVVEQWTYDDDGNMLDHRYILNGAVMLIISYTYDDEGNKIGETSQPTTAGRKTFYEFFYDQEGKLIKEVVKDSLGDGGTYEWTYDKYGNVQKEVFTNIKEGSIVVEYSGYKLFYKPQK